MSGAGNDVTKLDQIADSSFVKSVGKISMVLIVPAILWVGGTLTSVDRRLLSVENQLKNFPPVTREEFVTLKENVSNRFTSNERWLGSNGHRIEVLEAVRDRVGPRSR